MSNKEDFLNQFPEEIREKLRMILNKIEKTMGQIEGVDGVNIGEMMAQREQIHKKMLEHRDKNKDDRTKSVGDRVKIWDGSFLEIIEDNIKVNEYFKDRDKMEELGKGYVDTPCIVAQEKQKYEGIFPFTDMMKEEDAKMNLDLVLWVPSMQKHVRTASRFVKLID